MRKWHLWFSMMLASSAVGETIASIANSTQTLFSVVPDSGHALSVPSRVETCCRIRGMLPNGERCCRSTRRSGRIYMGAAREASKFGLLHRQDQRDLYLAHLPGGSVVSVRIRFTGDRTETDAKTRARLVESIEEMAARWLAGSPNEQRIPENPQAVVLK